MNNSKQPEQEAEALPSVCDKGRRQSITAGGSYFKK